MYRAYRNAPTPLIHQIYVYMLSIAHKSLFAALSAHVPNRCTRNSVPRHTTAQTVIIIIALRTPRVLASQNRRPTSTSQHTHTHTYTCNDKLSYRVNGRRAQGADCNRPQTAASRTTEVALQTHSVGEMV